MSGSLAESEEELLLELLELLELELLLLELVLSGEVASPGKGKKPGFSAGAGALGGALGSEVAGVGVSGVGAGSPG
jgi:hypothetical protein